MCRFLYFLLFMFAYGGAAVLSKATKNKSNNVCDTLAAYGNIENNVHCWYNPDLGSTPEELVTRYGFKFEQHIVETEDHYRLAVFRVQDVASGTDKGPVLMQHGLSSNSMNFLMRGEKSLAFHMARNGYDVWLTNARGSKFNPDHVYLNMTHPKVWDYSFHEMGVYDIPAVVEYIYNQAQDRKLVYIGFSMGTTVGFVYGTQRKEHAEKHLKAFVMLGVTTILGRMLEDIKAMHYIITGLVSTFVSEKINVLLLDSNSQNQQFFNTCFRSTMARVCIANLFMITGEDYEGIAMESFPLFSPDRLSVKTLLHFLQNIESQEFKAMDYGREENLKRYNTPQAPVYAMEKITIPVHIFYAENDLFANERDSREVYGRLMNSQKKSIQRVPPDGSIRYNHLDFILAKDIDKFVNEPILHAIEDS